MVYVKEEKQQDVFFGKPPDSPFTLPGTYVTPEGKMSVGAGEAIREAPTKEVVGGGGRRTPTRRTRRTITPTPITPTPTTPEATQLQPATISAYSGEEYTPGVFRQTSFTERIRGSLETFKTGRFYTIGSSLFSYKIIKDISGKPSPYISQRGTEITDPVYTPIEFREGVTIGQRREFELTSSPFSARGYATPEAKRAWAEEEIAKDVQAEAQTKYNIEQADLQKLIYAGGATVPEAEERLGRYKEKLETGMPKISEERFEKAMFLSGAGKIKQFSTYKQVDYGKYIETAGWVGGGLVAPVAVGGAMFLSGASRFWTAPQEPTTSGKLLAGGIGLAGIAFGAGISTGKIAKDITYGEIRGLAETKPRFNIGARTQLGAGKFRDVYASYEKIGGAQRVIKAEVVSEQVGTKGLSKVSATAETYIKAYKFPTGEPIHIGARTYFKGVGYTTPLKAVQGGTPSIIYGRAGKAWEFSSINLGARANIKIYSKYYPKQDVLVGGVAEKQGDVLKALSGGIRNIGITDKTTAFSFGVEDVTKLKILGKPTGVGESIVSGKGSSITLTTQSSFLPTKSIVGQISKVSYATATPPISRAGFAGFSGLKQITTTREQTKLTPTILPVQTPKTTVKQEARLFSGSMLRGGLISVPTTRERLFQITQPTIKQLTTQRLSQKMIAPMIPSTPTTPLIPTTRLFTPQIIPFIPRIRMSMPSALGGREIGGKEFFRYSPSFAAITYKIKAPKIPSPPFKKRYWTGLEIRPIISGSKIKIPKLRF